MSKREKANASSGTKGVRFEEAVERIEQVIEKIESGKAGLEESLVDYEQATKLIGHCRSILQVTEKRIASLTSDREGNLQVSDDVDQTAADS